MKDDLPFLYHILDEINYIKEKQPHVPVMLFARMKT